MTTCTRYKHDCDACVALGPFAAFDLYYCERCDGGSVIARRSSDPPDYSSAPVAIVTRSPGLMEGPLGVAVARMRSRSVP